MPSRKLNLKANLDMPGKKRSKAARKLQARNPDATQRRILGAAKIEFARNGLGGARVDTIAARAKANKRMIYHYFINKEKLFQAVIEQAYLDIRTAEQKLELDHLPPAAALERLVRFTWNYYLGNPEFLTLVNSENLHKACHLKKSKIIGTISRRFVRLVDNLLKRGMAAGVFRKGIDPVQLNITIAAVGYYYLTNRFTGSIIFRKNMMSAKALEQRLTFNIETIMQLVSRNPA